MRPRRFTGDTLLDAVRRAKEACGPDALVVAARRISSRGWFRRPRDEAFEVTVLTGAVGVRTGADAVDAEWREPFDALAPLSEGLARLARLEDGLRELRTGVEALERRIADDASPSQRLRSRVARVRIAGHEPGAES